MSTWQMSLDLRAPISSAGSPSGITPCASQDGLTISRSGPAPVPASRSLSQGSTKVRRTRGTSGPSGSGSSASIAPPSFSANKSPAPTPSDVLARALALAYHRQTERLGSTLYELTWKELVTPSGHSLPMLRASGRRTSASGSIGWPTPRTSDSQGGVETAEALKARQAGGISLRDASALAGWPTPQAHDVTTRGNTSAELHRQVHDLSNAALLTGWPTSTRQDGSSSGAAGYPTTETHPAGVTLTDAARMTGLPTPSANDWKGSSRIGQRRGQLSEAALYFPPNAGQSTDSGETPSGLTASTGSAGRLNPELPRWLQGLPAEWAKCAPSGMRSARRKRSRSPGP